MGHALLPTLAKVPNHYLGHDLKPSQGIIADAARGVPTFHVIKHTCHWYTNGIMFYCMYRNCESMEAP